MAMAGSILIADDEGTFRESTSRLLQREGFDCRAVGDAEEAIEHLKRQRFDLLIADIRMPRNPDLRVVRTARQLDPRLAVILVTGYPSMDTAICSVALPVVAYLTKPLDFDELLGHIRPVIERSDKRRQLVGVRERLESCLAELRGAETEPCSRQQARDELVSLGTVRTLASCLNGLMELAPAGESLRGSPGLCELLDCPQKPVYRQAIHETIRVLRKTKETFKSKAIAELRVKLEQLVENQGNLDGFPWTRGTASYDLGR